MHTCYTLFEFSIILWHPPTVTGPQLLLILKWGGELTSVGQRQAEELGRAFRCMYPGGEGEYASLPGSGFLRLHSTYRHDLKVYASDEGRVQMTAAAFTKVNLLLYLNEIKLDKNPPQIHAVILVDIRH